MFYLSKSWRRITGYSYRQSIRLLSPLMLGIAYGLRIIHPKSRWHRNNRGFVSRHDDFYSLCNPLHALHGTLDTGSPSAFGKRSQNGEKTRACNITAYSRSGLPLFIQWLSKSKLPWILLTSYTRTFSEHQVPSSLIDFATLPPHFFLPWFPCKYKPLR